MNRNFYEDIKEIKQAIKDVDNVKIKSWLVELLKYKSKYDISYIITTGYNPCIMCGEKTDIIEVCSEGRFCSLECETKFYESLPI